jgi:plasmid stabilization system protein ParE
VARRVVFTRLAEKHFEQAAQWWSENRPAAPDALRDDVAATLALLAEQPAVGALARDTDLVGVRRVALHRVRYHLYYRFDEDTVTVLALWHSSRGAGPTL